MIDNEFYKFLGDKWHSSEGDAVALLRLEKAVTTPWVLGMIRAHGHSASAEILDVGCGGGLLTLVLDEHGYRATGLDVSEEILKVGRALDREHRVSWAEGRAESLPFSDESFDVVCLMDVLEHISVPREALIEAVRVLRPDGTLLLHTFNRTWLAWLLAVKGLDWFIRDSVKHIHDWSLFIKPSDIEKWLLAEGLERVRFTGIRPSLFTRATLKLLLTRRVPETFSFELCKNLSVGYLGSARVPMV